MKQKFQDLIHCSSQLGKIFGVENLHFGFGWYLVCTPVFKDGGGGGGRRANFLLTPFRWDVL